MQHPTLSGALSGLTVLNIADRLRFQQAVEAGGQSGWAYYFPYLLSRNSPGKSCLLIGEDDGSVLLFRWRRRGSEERLDLYFPPTPMNLGALDRGLDRANSFNGDRSARILRIDAADTESLSARPGFRIKQRKSQYVFAPESYRTLAGGKLRTVRRQIALIENRDDVQVAPWTPEDLDDCRELLRDWRKHHRQAHGTAGGAGTTELALNLLTELPKSDMRAELVRVGDRLVSFAIGGAIRKGLACFLDAKCDAEVPGLSYFHRRSFLSNLSDFDRVNDGSDAGRPGLQQLKESFRPVEMHGEFRASQRR